MEQPPEYAAYGKNVMCNLKKAIYSLEQSPRTWFDKFSKIFTKDGTQRCNSNHFVFIFVVLLNLRLVVHVGNIFLTAHGVDGIEKTKDYLKEQLVTKDIGRPRYLLEIEIAHNKYVVVLSEQKYSLNLLQESTWLKHVCTPSLL